MKINALPISIRVSIVDRFQGQEQDIIILSMTRSNHENRIGFLSNLQRLNVGLSRAKHNLIVVGDHEFFKKLPKRNENMLVRNLACYCKNNLVHYNANKNTTQAKKAQKDSTKKKKGDT
jgi:superfamily I DNA and/or RNA helicase